MNLTARVNKPEYFYQPRQFLRRLTRAIRRAPDEAGVVLPWGLRMRVNPSEDHGRSLYHFGVYDLVLSEAIWRLLDRCERAIDIGANIGYVTGLMAARLGPRGEVLAFEPHPKIFAELVLNIEGWANRPIATIRPFPLALSSNTGSAYLEEAKNFDRNSGTSRVTANGAHACGSTRRVWTTFAPNMATSILSNSMLKGMNWKCCWEGKAFLIPGACETSFLRTIARSFNSPVASLLASFGYVIFMLTRTFRGPLLAAQGERCPTVHYLPPNFLATREPKRASARFETSGWQVLR